LDKQAEVYMKAAIAGRAAGAWRVGAVRRCGGEQPGRTAAVDPPADKTAADKTLVEV
jgi:hypothetical protein